MHVSKWGETHFVKWKSILVKVVRISDLQRRWYLETAITLHSGEQAHDFSELVK